MAKSANKVPSMKMKAGGALRGKVKHGVTSVSKPQKMHKEMGMTIGGMTQPIKAGKKSMSKVAHARMMKASAPKRSSY